jgi:hypothetical protein
MAAIFSLPKRSASRRTCSRPSSESSTSVAPAKRSSVESIVAPWRTKKIRVCMSDFCPRREWSPREWSDIDLSPAGVSERARANQSNRTEERRWRYHFSWRASSCPRRESNPHLRFRKPSFYPLNYGDKSICDLESPAVASHPLRQFANADSPEALDSSGSSLKRRVNYNKCSDGALSPYGVWQQLRDRLTFAEAAARRPCQEGECGQNDALCHTTGLACWWTQQDYRPAGLAA